MISEEEDKAIRLILTSLIRAELWSSSFSNEYEEGTVEKERMLITAKEYKELYYKIEGGKFVIRKVESKGLK